MRISGVYISPFLSLPMRVCVYCVYVCLVSGEENSTWYTFFLHILKNGSHTFFSPPNRRASQNYFRFRVKMSQNLTTAEGASRNKKGATRESMLYPGISLAHHSKNSTAIAVILPNSALNGQELLLTNDFVC